MSRTAAYSDEFLLRLIQRAMSPVLAEGTVITCDDSLVDRFNGPDAKLDDGECWFFFRCRLQRELLLPAGWIEDLFPFVQGESEDEVFERCRKVTVGVLIAHIQCRYPAVSFAPLDLPGMPGCDAAGVFLGMKDLVRRISPLHARFAPSTPVAHVMRGSNLWSLWEQLTVLSEARVPLPPASQLKLGGWCYILTFVSVVIGFVGECGQPGWGWLLLGMLCGFGWFVLGKCLRESAVPLPPGVITWGDLARYLTPMWPGTHEIGR